MSDLIEVKGLSVRQPWGFAISDLGKLVENRSRRTNYRGWVAIHAPLTRDDGVLMPTPEADRLHRAAQRDLNPRLYAHGFILALAELASCHHADECDEDDETYDGGASKYCSPWAQPGQWHWQLAQVKATALIRCTGARGLFPLPLPVKDAVIGRIPIDQDGNPIPAASPADCQPNVSG